MRKFALLGLSWFLGPASLRSAAAPQCLFFAVAHFRRSTASLSVFNQTSCLQCNVASTQTRSLNIAKCSKNLKTLRDLYKPHTSNSEP